MSKVRKYLLFVVLCLTLGALLVPGIVLGSYNYYVTISVSNNNTGALSGLPVLVSINNTQLANLGYINSNGLDTKVLEGSNPIDYLVADDYLGLFIENIEGSQKRVYLYRLGESSPQTNFPVIVGDGGYIAIDDRDSLELGNNFSIKFEGWIDTSTSKDYIAKGGAFTVATQGTGDIYAVFSRDLLTYTGEYWQDDYWDAGYSSGGGSQSKTGSYLYLDAYGSAGDGERTYVTNFTVDLTGVNTLYIDWVNFGGANSIQESYFIASTSKTGFYGTYSARLSRSNQFSRQTDSLDVSGLSGNHYIRVHAFSPSTTFHSTIAVYGIWCDVQGAKSVSTSLSSGECEFGVWANGINLGIDIGGTTVNSTDLGGVSVLGTADNWTISIPYFTSYNQSVNGGPKVWYKPITMVLGTTLTDRSGNGAHGVITWGSNPYGVSVEVGGIEPFSAYVLPGGDMEETIPGIIPGTGTTPTAIPEGATGNGLPLHASFLAAANSLHWSLPTTYMVAFLIISLVMGVAAAVAVKSWLGFAIGFGAFTLVFSQVRDSGGYHIVPLGVTILCLSVAVFLGYLGRNA